MPAPKKSPKKGRGSPKKARGSPKKARASPKKSPGKKHTTKSKTGGHQWEYVQPTGLESAFSRCKGKRGNEDCGIEKVSWNDEVTKNSCQVDKEWNCDGRDGCTEGVYQYERVDGQTINVGKLKCLPKLWDRDKGRNFTNYNPAKYSLEHRS